MSAAEILKLLIEAQTCNPNRATDIQILLGEAAWKAPGREIGNVAAEETLTGLIDHIFVTTWQENPAGLPGLLPFFLAVCGHRKNGAWIR